MKYLYNKFSVIIAGALLLTLASCEKDAVREPSPAQDGGVQAYIAETNKTLQLFLPGDEATSFTVRIGRQNTAGRVKLPLVITDKNGLLDWDSDAVIFENGAAVAELEVDFSAMRLGESATLELAIKDEGDRYLYGLSKYSITVLRDYNWVNVGAVEFTDPAFGLGTAKVPIEQAEGTTLFRLPNLYYELCMAAKDSRPIEKGFHLQFRLDTTYTDASQKYRKYTAVSLPDNQDLGVGYYLRWDASWGQYCTFTNYGSHYSIGHLLVQEGSSNAAVLTSSFVWIDGFKGEEFDPYKGETIVIDTLKRANQTGSMHIQFGGSYSYKAENKNYGGVTSVPVDSYRVKLTSTDLELSLDVNVLRPSHSRIRDGVYPINSSNDSTSVRAGSAMVFPQAGSYARLPSIDDKAVLYLVSGTVAFQYDAAGKYTVTVDAITGKGSVIQASWKDITPAP
jgi:hypothetical protein